MVNRLLSSIQSNFFRNCACHYIMSKSAMSTNCRLNQSIPDAACHSIQKQRLGHFVQPDSTHFLIRTQPESFPYDEPELKKRAEAISKREIMIPAAPGNKKDGPTGVFPQTGESAGPAPESSLFFSFFPDSGKRGRLKSRQSGLADGLFLSSLFFALAPFRKSVLKPSIKRPDRSDCPIPLAQVEKTEKARFLQNGESGKCFCTSLSSLAVSLVFSIFICLPGGFSFSVPSISILSGRLVKNERVFPKMGKTLSFFFGSCPSLLFCLCFLASHPAIFLFFLLKSVI